MAVLYTPHFIQFIDDTGTPLSGGKLYTYAAGTTTPKATYTTQAATVENANPVVLDSAGRAVIFIEGAYKFALYDADDNLIRTTDNITSFSTIEGGISAAMSPVCSASTLADARSAFGLGSAATSSTSDFVAVADMKVLKRAAAESTALDSTTSQIPYDNTIPQSSEGKEFLTISYTPKSATSKILVTALVHVSNNTTNGVTTVALFKDSAADAVSAAASTINPNSVIDPVCVSYSETTGSTTARTFKVRFGRNAPGETAYINGRGDTGTAVFGGVLRSFISIVEYEP